MSGRQSPLDYLFFLRPVLLPPVWTIGLLGTLPRDPAHDIPWLIWLGFMMHLTTLFGGVYTLNQICDIESDRLNHKLYFLPDGIIAVRAAWIFTLVLDVVALVLSLAFGRVYVLLTVMVMSLGILYSVGSHPWKNRPWLGLLANAVGHGTIVYLFGATLTGRFVSENGVQVLAYSLAVGGVYLATTVPDADGDRATGKRTLAVAWGAQTALVVAFTLVGIATILAAWIGDRFLAFSAVTAWPFFLRAVFRPHTGSTAAKAAVAALSVAAVVAYPLYAALLILGFVGTRRFFRWRFGINYPTLV